VFAPLPGAEEVEVPAAATSSQGALELQPRVELLEGRRVLRLRIGDGEALLVLQDPVGAGDGYGFGEGQLSSPGPGRAAAFVDEVARWLEVEQLAAETPDDGAPPWPLAYVYLGDGKEGPQSWQVCKLFFEDRRDSAEVYLRVSPDGDRAQLLREDASYHEPLVALLARALRDGPLPMRGTASDPNLSSLRPLVAEPQRLNTGGRPLGVLAWSGSGLLGVQGDGLQSVLLRWEDPASPPAEIARLPGRVEALLPSPDGALAALEVAYPREPGRWSSDDPSSLLVAELAKGRVRTLVGDAEQIKLHGAAWSPSGELLAAPGWDRSGEPPHLGLVRLLDVSSGETRASTVPELDLWPLCWELDGLLLGLREPVEGMAPAAFRWRFDTGELAAAGTSGHRSPDGRYTVEPHADGLLVRRGRGKARLFEGHFDGDREALQRWAQAGHPHWAGRHHLAVRVDDGVLALDLASLKWQPLSAVSVGLPLASPDGRRLLLATGDEPWWGAAP